METSIKTLAALFAAAILTDEEINDSECLAAMSAGATADLPESEFARTLNHEIASLDGKSSDEVIEYASSLASEVAPDDIFPVFEAMMDIFFADKKLRSSEIRHLITISNMLGMSVTDAVMLICERTRSDLSIQLMFDN